MTFGTAGVNVEAEVTETRADGVDPTIFHTVRGTMRFPHRPRVAVEFTIEEFQGDLTTTVNSFGGELDDRSLKLIFETALKYVIDYRSPPGGLGHIILEDGTEIHVPYASGYEDGATDDPGWDEERRMLREHGVTHVVDAEFYSDLEYEEMQKHDLFELIPIADWLRKLDQRQS